MLYLPLRSLLNEIEATFSHLGTQLLVVLRRLSISLGSSAYYYDTSGRPTARFCVGKIPSIATAWQSTYQRFRVHHCRLGDLRYGAESSARGGDARCFFEATADGAAIAIDVGPRGRMGAELRDTEHRD